MSSALMFTVLLVSNSRAAHLTGLCAGVLVTIYIVVEAPISGMSLNSARTLGSAVAAGAWTDLWIYFTAPPLGMLLASELYVRLRGLGSSSARSLRTRAPARASSDAAMRQR